MSKELHDLLTEMVELYQKHQCFLAVHAERLCALLPAAPAAPAAWQPIDTAPKDVPILAYCNHEVDVGLEANGRTMTLYAAHWDGLSHCSTGVHIVEWGGGWDDRTYEDSSGGHLPDWWFVAGSEFEVAANPTHWMPLPPSPEASKGGV